MRRVYKIIRPIALLGLMIKFAGISIKERNIYAVIVILQPGKTYIKKAGLANTGRTIFNTKRTFWGKLGPQGKNGHNFLDMIHRGGMACRCIFG